MIPDSQTNFLYLADSLPRRYPLFYRSFEKTLLDFGIAFDLIPKTKDVWAADYMPIQTDLNKFIRFLYRPGYLTGSKKYLNTISDVDAICLDLHLTTTKVNIILDGGNIVRTKNKVIMTDRVFTENNDLSRETLISELHELLQIEKLIFIPQLPDDFTGHADGMVRFLDENTVVISNFKKEKQFFQRAFKLALQNAGLDMITIPYNVYENISIYHANGCYINYLELGDIIIIPIFGKKEDDDALKQLETIFSGKQIGTIECNEIAREGGVLHCISWAILK